MSSNKVEQAIPAENSVEEFAATEMSEDPREERIGPGTATVTGVEMKFSPAPEDRSYNPKGSRKDPIPRAFHDGWKAIVNVPGAPPGPDMIVTIVEGKHDPTFREWTYQLKDTAGEIVKVERTLGMTQWIPQDWLDRA